MPPPARGCRSVCGGGGLRNTCLINSDDKVVLLTLLRKDILSINE